MTETEQLVMDIDRLRESLAIDWRELDELALTFDERRRIRSHIQQCTHDLVALMNRIDEAEVNTRT